MTQEKGGKKDIAETFAPDVQVSGSSTPAPADSEATYPASELLGLVVGITEGKYEAPYAAGALRHANIQGTDLITRKAFLEALENFKSAEAF